MAPRDGVVQATEAPESPPVDIRMYKLFPPPSYAGAIQRSGIVARVLREGCEPVAVLQGPAGSGKTTTMQQILQACSARGWRTAWLSLDEADNDPQRLEAHMEAVAARLERRPAGGRPGGAGTDAGRDLSDWLLDRLSRLGEPVAVFLDEFQALRSETVLHFFRALLQHLPARVRLFISSRTLPELGLATLLVNRQAFVLRADDLRFSCDEAAQFFAADTTLGLRREEVEAIHQRTEGWPAGLQLYRLALANPAVRDALDGLDSDGPRELAEYLTDNVVSLQPPRTQAFLLRTSLLRRMCAPLCEAVTGFGDARLLLAQLDAAGLFVRPLDAGGHWFKYHGLFASFLAAGLRRTSPEQAQEVHAQAARWYVAHDLHEEAVFHALQARDWALAGQTLSAWASRLIASAELVTVERWYEALPFDSVALQPALAIKAAYALTFLRRRDKLRPLVGVLAQHRGRGDVGTTTHPDFALAMAAVFEDDLHGAVRAVDKQEIWHRADGGFPAFELGAAANLLAFGKVAAGDFESARKVLAMARTHNRRGGASFSGGYTAAVGGANLMAEGRLQEALAHLRAGLSEPQARLDKSTAATALPACMLWALYEANELAEMETLAAASRQAIAESAIPDFIAIAHIAISRMHEARGRPEQAAEAVEQLERIGHDSHWPRLVRLADWERVRRAIATGELQRAQAIAERIGPAGQAVPPGWVLLAEDIEGDGFGRLRLAIHRDDLLGASRHFAAESSRQPGRLQRQVKLLVLDALLQRRKGLLNAAHRSLRKALGLARPGGLVRSFLDEGPAVVEMLQHEHRQLLAAPEDPVAGDHDRGARRYVEALLAAAGAGLPWPAERPAPRAAALSPLSEREQEMLLFLCNGVSNKEIATRLFVSENTVKFHLKNIYAKLSVGNRAQAINAARALRLGA
ncbi:LuxR C-terminal-related transcriptional regulator [Aquincola sp. MAHUQ-54]|uniref:LuxR C-terminal-related transcriptional regulator n=1 Tax=Aquincola agrisoli TaxID=3119538 RepID=A0AAW9Q7X7_9BURK